jgi:hypothetical protein
LKKKFPKFGKKIHQTFKTTKFLKEASADNMFSNAKILKKRLQPKNCYRVLLSDSLSLVVMKGCTTGF